MTPHYADDHLTIYAGDVREVLPTLPDASVHCVVTSPPYWGLRDYGTATWDGGDVACDHKGEPFASSSSSLAGYTSENVQIRTQRQPMGATCRKCGARRIDAQLGLEPTPEEYVASLVGVFREVRRVLRADGTVWLNLGDSYASPIGGNNVGLRTADYGAGNEIGKKVDELRATRDASQVRKKIAGLKPKDLVGIPWRVAFALQADGWYLRSDIIWSKPNPMPESVTDRPTKSHEYLFLLTRSARYTYDADAVRESSTGQQGAAARFYRPSGNSRGAADGRPDHGGSETSLIDRHDDGARNLRSVWTIATQPYPGAHFATFPEKLVEPCILAGTSGRGVCPECGAPWTRVVERGAVQPEPDGDQPKRLEPGQAGNVGAGNMGFRASRLSGQEMARWKAEHPDQTTGWRPSCAHDAEPVSATVLDPFAGSGTVGRVANRLGRRAILVELNPDYIDQAMLRNAQAPLGIVS